MVIEILHLFVFSKSGDFISIFEHHVAKKIKKGIMKLKKLKVGNGKKNKLLSFHDH